MTDEVEEAPFPDWFWRAFAPEFAALGFLLGVGGVFASSRTTGLAHVASVLLAVVGLGYTGLSLAFLLSVVFFSPRGEQDEA